MMAEETAAQIREASTMLPGEALPFSRDEFMGALGMFREILCDATDAEAVATTHFLEAAIQKLDEATDILQQAQGKMRNIATNVGGSATGQAAAITPETAPTRRPDVRKPKLKDISYAPFPDSVDDPLVRPLIETMKSITEARDMRELRQVLPVNGMRLLMHKGQVRGFYAAAPLVDYQLNEGEVIYCALYLGVAPKYRGRGYGAEILARIEEEARAAGIDVIAVSPTETSEAFYAHHGFAFIYENPDEDGHEMRKRLT